MEKEALPEIYNLNILGKSVLLKPDTVLVDRGTKWGNPFIMFSENDRNYVCDMFIRYANWRLTVEPQWLTFLRGKNLVCHCYPKRCHAETLRRLANE